MAFSKLRSGNNYRYTEKMKSNMLPTNWDVIAHYHYVREKMMAEDAKLVNSKFPNFNEVKQEVISDIKSVWTLSSLPVISDKRIEKRIKLLLGSFNKEKKKASKSGTRIQDAVFAELFDICTCKCDISLISVQGRTEKIPCRCPKERRIPCQGNYTLNTKSLLIPADN